MFYLSSLTLLCFSVLLSRQNGACPAPFPKLMHGKTSCRHEKADRRARARLRQQPFPLWAQYCGRKGYPWSGLVSQGPFSCGIKRRGHCLRAAGTLQCPLHLIINLSSQQLRQPHTDGRNKRNQKQGDDHTYIEGKGSLYYLFHGHLGHSGTDKQYGAYGRCQKADTAV